MPIKMPANLTPTVNCVELRFITKRIYNFLSLLSKSKSDLREKEKKMPGYKSIIFHLKNYLLFFFFIF